MVKGISERSDDSASDIHIPRFRMLDEAPRPRAYFPNDPAISVISPRQSTGNTPRLT
jgi:hypothetical protein